MGSTASDLAIVDDVTPKTFGWCFFVVRQQRSS